jgi:hypothetical protein
MVITELAASERLLTASITIAMELEVSPTNALNAARNTFAEAFIFDTAKVRHKRHYPVYLLYHIQPVEKQKNNGRISVR